jgi:hypothetical protein
MFFDILRGLKEEVSFQEDWPGRRCAQVLRKAAAEAFGLLCLWHRFSKSVAIREIRV